MPQVQIKSILGGHSIASDFATPSQFRASLGIDPSLPNADTDDVYSSVASGYIRPTATQNFASTTITSSPLWIKTNPKNALVYVYDAKGSAYTVDATMTTVTALADAGTLSSSLGNGCEYYDNYMYFFTNTDVTRYGPLNGAAGFVINYWTGTLAKTALTNTAYPTTYKNNLQLPNHVACRHSDGRLYFTDVVGNLGTVHYIATTKTSVEGDTNNGSTYSALTLGYGLWPTAIESYGTDLAIAIYEGSGAGLRQPRAKIAFWDTTSTSASKIVWVEFPDTLITAIKNVNGVLYVVSGNINQPGYRVSQFVGSYSFQEVYYSETGEPCLPGAIDGVLNRVFIGTFTKIPDSDGVITSIGLSNSKLSTGIFNVLRCSSSSSSTSVSSVLLADNNPLNRNLPIFGWTQAGEGSTNASYGLDKQGTTYNNSTQYFWSQVFRAGSSFKITKVRIPFASVLNTNAIIIPTIRVDDGTNAYTLRTINKTNDGNNLFAVIRTSTTGTITGYNNFWLEFAFTGAALAVIALPILIDFEFIQE